MSKTERAEELKRQAQEIADLRGKNPVLMGIIALEFKNDPELWEAAGYKSYDNCMEGVFGKKKSSAYRWRQIVERLLERGFATQEQLLDWGCVKAQELSRLPESQLGKGEWQAKATAMDGAAFKDAVAGFLADRPDHIEQKFFWIHQAMPESFKPVWEAALVTAEALAQQDGEVLENKSSRIEYVVAGFVKVFAPLVSEVADGKDVS